MGIGAQQLKAFIPAFPNGLYISFQEKLSLRGMAEETAN
jgi:hypothetical protein